MQAMLSEPKECSLLPMEFARISRGPAAEARSTEEPAASPWQPAAPFNKWPVQFVSIDAGGFTWYAPPGVFITQSCMQRATLQAAKIVRRTFDIVWQHTKAEMAPKGGLVVIHDWRIPQTFDREVARYWMQQSTLMPPGSIRALYLAVNTNPLLRMAGHAALFLWTEAMGQSAVDLVSSPDVALRKYDVRAPAPSGLPGLPRRTA